MRHRLAGLTAVTGFLLATPAIAQDRPEVPAAVEPAVEEWLASEHDSQALLDRTVAAVLADQKNGIAHVGKLLAASADEPRAPRSKGIAALATHVALAFLQRETSRSVVFAGQYLPLRPLQPLVSDLYFSWLIDTPDWYPDTHRVHLVPALRDLQPGPPGPARLESVIEIVENEAIEPRNLRTALACMLWQWGRREYVQPRLDELVRTSAEGEADERVQALLRLADLQYTLREYGASAATHRALQSVAAGAGVRLKPVDWYSAACVNALCGQVDRGIEAFEKCVELQASPDVDSSHKVEREVFETDPEIAALRRHERFPELLARALEHSPEAKSGRR